MLSLRKRCAMNSVSNLEEEEEEGRNKLINNKIFFSNILCIDTVELKADVEEDHWGGVILDRSRGANAVTNEISERGEGTVGKHFLLFVLAE